MTTRFTFALILALGVVMMGAHRAHAARPCPPDINCSGQVNVNDLLAVISAWGQTNTPANVNGLGAVDVDDLLAVISAWGDCHFNFGPVYPNAEAWQIGLEFVTTLTLPQATYIRIDRDLGLIRTAFPALASQTHTMAWAPNQLIVAKVQGQDHTDYNCTNTYYQMTTEAPLFSSGGVDYVVVTFAGKLNVEALAAIYSTLPGINFAEPNGLIGGENFWTPSILISPVGSWRWNIDDGFLDCFDGCDCHRVYTIDTDLAGNVTLVDLQQFGQSWCRF